MLRSENINPRIYVKVLAGDREFLARIRPSYRYPSKPNRTLISPRLLYNNNRQLWGLSIIGRIIGELFHFSSFRSNPSIFFSSSKIFAVRSLRSHQRYVTRVAIIVDQRVVGSAYQRHKWNSEPSYARIPDNMIPRFNAIVYVSSSRIYNFSNNKPKTTVSINTRSDCSKLADDGRRRRPLRKYEKFASI